MQIRSTQLRKKTNLQIHDIKKTDPIGPVFLI